MKVLTFSFANSPIDHGKKVAMALMHHAFPKRHDLLFAYEYKEPYYPTLPSDLNMFQRTGDWKRELERCECPHWRITCINGTSDAFMLTAGETLIVPSSVLDYNLMESARHFRSGRVPIWVWGRPEGAALLRSGELLQTDQSATTESVLLEQVSRVLFFNFRKLHRPISVPTGLGLPIRVIHHVGPVRW
jgi:myotubularin-related protein 10/11/12